MSNSKKDSPYQKIPQILQQTQPDPEYDQLPLELLYALHQNSKEDIEGKRKRNIFRRKTTSDIRVKSRSFIKVKQSSQSNQMLSKSQKV